ncbi:camphor resistance protein CrcB [Oenococcus sp. UCMA 17063]|nr:camphor resistance protein CrcB [Oenococcus sp. UCMA 17063]
MIKVFSVALGAALGVLGRYQITNTMKKKWLNMIYPWPTFLINFCGCFLLGLFYSLNLSENIYLFLSMGFTATFTTFSTFNLENVELLKSHQYRQFLKYIFTTYLLGFLGIYSGFMLGSFLYRS